MIERIIVFTLGLLSVIVFHELSHVLTARLLGWSFNGAQLLPRPPKITWKDNRFLLSVAPMSVSISPRKLSSSIRLQVKLVALAGPMANIAMGLAVIVLADRLYKLIGLAHS